MAGIFPNTGVTASNATNTVDTATTGCTELFHSTSRCKPLFDPASANAVMSELLNSVSTAGLTYDCSKLTNLSDAIKALATAAANALAPCGMTGATQTQFTNMNNDVARVPVCDGNGSNVSITFTQLKAKIVDSVATPVTPCTATAANATEIAALSNASPILTCVGGNVRSVTRAQFLASYAPTVTTPCNATTLTATDLANMNTATSRALICINGVLRSLTLDELASASGAAGALVTDNNGANNVRSYGGGGTFTVPAGCWQLVNGTVTSGSGGSTTLGGTAFNNGLRRLLFNTAGDTAGAGTSSSSSQQFAGIVKGGETIILAGNQVGGSFTLYRINC